MPAPFRPSASTDDGKRSALPTDATFGRKPCWSAFGQIAPTTLFVGTWLHMSRKTAMMSSRPQKKWYVHLKPFAGSPLRPKNHGCHGAIDEMQGPPLAS